MTRAVMRYFAVLAVLVVTACDKAPLVAPISSTITISASTTVLAPGGSTEVMAYVVEEVGTPVHCTPSLEVASPIWR